MPTHPLCASSSLALALALAVAVAACAHHQAAAPPAAPVAAAPAAPPEVPGHSVDLAAMDPSVRPGQDFFLYANGAWYAKAEIPADRSSAGVWLRVQDQVEKRTSDLLTEAGKGTEPDLKQVGDYYAAYLDAPAIEKRGLAPLAPTLSGIAKLKNKKALSALLGSQLRADVDALNATNFHTDNVLGLWVEQDLNDPSRAVGYLLQGGLGMPDRSYYLDATAPMEAHRKAYVHHLAAMFKLAGLSKPDARAARAFALEKRIAEAHSTRADSEDVSKGNNPWPRKDFATRAPGMSWDAFFTAAGLQDQASFIVWHPHAVTGLAALVQSEPLATWKDYLTARALDHAAPFLPKAFVDEHFAFYGTDLTGIPTQPERWKLAVRATNDAIGQAVGKAYVARYFPPESKRAVERLVADLIAAFGRRIDALAWMKPETKAKAKEKLATLKVGVGYPDKWIDYGGLTVKRDDAFGNFERAERFEYQRNLAKLGHPIDRGEWAMLPHEVNAVNLPVRNALNFPAAILVPPFFDPASTDAANYGDIGATIGHEISHSFDDQGSKFDAQGRFVSWWTPEDFAHFEASGAALAAQFSAYHPLPDVAIDGKQTLSENIADLAGLAVAYDAWQRSLGGRPAPMQDGLTGDQQFFLSHAQGWQSKQREPDLRRRLASDGHAPPHYRTLTVRNLDPWYAAFDVKPTDALYLEPKARVAVW
jgi:putative endopeptidase